MILTLLVSQRHAWGEMMSVNYCNNYTTTKIQLPLVVALYYEKSDPPNIQWTAIVNEQLPTGLWTPPLL